MWLGAFCKGTGGSSLNAGKFCEAVYTILVGYPPDSYPATKVSRQGFVNLCRDLENKKPKDVVPEPIRLLIPRALPAIYDIRSNRGVGHISDKFDANQMDAAFGMATCNWVLAELVRVFVSANQPAFSTADAQALVEDLTRPRIPLIWKSGERRRVMDNSLNLYDQIVALVADGSVTKDTLLKDAEYYTDKYLTDCLAEGS